MSNDSTDNAPNDESTATTETAVVETEHKADASASDTVEQDDTAAPTEGAAPTNDGDDSAAPTEADESPDEKATAEEGIDKRACVVSVMIQTGAAKHGAETLATNMNDAEIDTVFDCLELKTGLKPSLKIADSAAYQKAMGQVSQRLDEEQKATVAGANKSEE